jgi:spore coat polysaccharide biosynthesis predicted glycosyltransferase SpsG
LIGTDFALLHPAFARWRRAALERRKDNAAARILISFGMSDAQGATLTALDALKTVQSEKKPGLKVDVALGSASPIADQLLQKAAALEYVSVQWDADPETMACLMVNADLAIAGGGSSAWERCALGLPSVILTIADNQKLAARSLQESGAAIVLGEHPFVEALTIAQTVRRLMTTPSERRALSLAAAKICDGRGAERVSIRLRKRLDRI